ncbi:HAD family hydrolase [Baekduia sp. Peel2402]|uniref:HAD family hydrolase n=1 Tax=Baekduia sp. Peel2402 TaxID=3458296 RepID=UPI00403E4B84
MPVRAVLFDFAGTLAMPEERSAWLAACGADEAHGDALDRAGRPGPTAAFVPAELVEVYEARDHDSDAHRAAYTGLFATVVDPELATVLYERTLVVEGWVAYADAVPVLEALRARGIRIAVVSNVGFDSRPILEGLGLLSLLDAVVLSYEVGAIKPEPEIFAAALSAVDVLADEALMVGDHAADGGAVTLGIRSLLLPYSPPGGVHGLDAVLALVEGTGT